ncbi:hypothetical protein VNO80_30592 [Phaseolus coccineus]|uniref:Secreted protein n=1 Tax=Phaseolus coccineus TaxID=3886 RepID=A0AAN9QJM6_PHACN
MVIVDVMIMLLACMLDGDIERKCSLRFCGLPSNVSNQNWNSEFANFARRTAATFVLKGIINQLHTHDNTSNGE